MLRIYFVILPIYLILLLTGFVKLHIISDNIISQRSLLNWVMKTVNIEEVDAFAI